IIEKVYVDEGDRVSAGDVIARLSDKDTLTELEKTKADIKDAQAKLTMLEAGPNPEDVEVAKATVSKAAGQLTFAESRLARFRTLFAEGLVARAELEDKQESATWAANDLAEAKRKLSALLNSIRPEHIEEASAQHERRRQRRPAASHGQRCQRRQDAARHHGDRQSLSSSQAGNDGTGQDLLRPKRRR